ncbi:MAG: tetratricopeptide repeat protein [Pirellulaceae bacterium]
MSEETRVNLAGREYVWDGDRWYSSDDYGSPPLGVVHQLNALIAKNLAAEDAAVTNIDDLIKRAKTARDAGQLKRAVDLAKQAYNSAPFNPGIAAVLCSIYRQMGKPELALQVAEKLPPTNYSPLLTSKAAALCDLERWEEALNVIRHVLAIGMNSKGNSSGEALGVWGRIKSKAPELCD